MGPLRVCQLITELELSGAERAMYELTRRLDRRRFRVHVAALRGGRLAHRLTAEGFRVTVLDVRCRCDAAALVRLVRLLRRERIELLHTHLFHAGFAGRIAARLAGVPHLVHTEQVAEMRFRPWQFAWARLTAAWCDRIVCCSNAVRDHHARMAHLPLGRYTVIYNGIDAPAYARDPARRRSLRADWGVADEEVLVAFVGRLDYQKNLPLLLRAASSLRQAGRAVRLVIAGDGPERPALQRFLETAGASAWVRWLGFTEDVAGVLSAADVFVLPSRWEGFALAVAEAMAARLPVIATSVPGPAELIEHGLSGLLVRSEDLAGLTDALRRLVDDPAERRRLARAGEARVREHFSIAANVAAHERLYLQVAAGDSPPA